MFAQIAELCSSLNYTFSVNSYREASKSIRFKWTVEAQTFTYSRSDFCTTGNCLINLLAYLERTG